MKLWLCILGITFQLTTSFAKEVDHPKLSKNDVQKHLTLLKTSRTPNVYSAVYYPKFTQDREGLKSIAVELIAEHANSQMKSGLNLKLVGEPLVKGKTAMVILHRSGGQIPKVSAPAFLYHDKTNGWGFIGLPIPYKRPEIMGFQRDSDDVFFEAALNDPTPFDGVLYEFDAATIKQFVILKP